MEVQLIYLATNIYIVSEVKHQGPLIFLKKPYQLIDKDGKQELTPFLQLAKEVTSHGHAIHRDHVIFYGATVQELTDKYLQLRKG